MPKIKVPRSSPSLDMTPMVDLAFLLVTFFMLTATMRTPEPVTVDTPSSIDAKEVPKNTMLITIDTLGRVFYNIENPTVRRIALENMAKRFEVKFTEEQLVKFSNMQSFGVSVKELPAYIDGDASKRKVMDAATKGIPIDTADQDKSELRFWIYNGRLEAKRFSDENPKLQLKPLRIAIKADNKSAYKKIDFVLDEFKRQEIFNFNLITNLEANPNEKKSK
ncbi:MAG: biopolymer transporter ExbD [Bacteroidia bacterium]|jgi:biopolymer transport protein ExbD|nr:biopolymer transporter ExbD [Bacteroidia bacterium]